MTTEPITVDDLAALHNLLDTRHPVRAIVWHGQPAFGKRRSHPRAHERMLLWAAPFFRRWLGPELPFSPVRRNDSLPVEAQRLMALGAAGCRVPAVLVTDQDVFVMEHAGQTLESLLRAEPDADVRLAWLHEAAADLAAFHAAGHWHGGAQLRNLVRTAGGTLARIDFETALDAHFPLPLLQAFDAALFLTSLARTPDAAALSAVAYTYLQTAPASARASLRRSFPLIRWLAHLWLVRHLAPKEAERLRLLAALPLV